MRFDRRELLVFAPELVHNGSEVQLNGPELAPFRGELVQFAGELEPNGVELRNDERDLGVAVVACYFFAAAAITG